MRKAAFFLRTPPTCYFINNCKYLAIGLFFYSTAIKTLFKQHFNSVLFYLTIVTKKETKCPVIICVYFNYSFSSYSNFTKKDIIFSSLLSAIESYHKRHAHRRTVKLAVKKIWPRLFFLCSFPFVLRLLLYNKRKSRNGVANGKIDPNVRASDQYLH